MLFDNFIFLLDLIVAFFFSIISARCSSRQCNKNETTREIKQNPTTQNPYENNTGIELKFLAQWILLYLCKGEVVEEMIVADSSHKGG